MGPLSSLLGDNPVFRERSGLPGGCQKQVTGNPVSRELPLVNGNFRLNSVPTGIMLLGCRVSRTRKDSNQITKMVLELVKRDDGTFDLFLNGRLERSHVAEKWLPDELCVRFGFCGAE